MFFGQLVSMIALAYQLRTTILAEGDECLITFADISRAKVFVKLKW